MPDESAKHTPGPWKIDKYGIITGGPYFCTSIGAVCTWDPKQSDTLEARSQVARTILEGYNGGIVAESISNARLIAAAPELLEACKAMLSPFEDEKESISLADALDLLKAAVAKATIEG